jgi:hypothetical protein
MATAAVTTIELEVGEAAVFRLTMKDRATGAPIVLAAGMTLHLWVRRRLEDAEAVLELFSGEGIEHADQDDCPGEADITFDTEDTSDWLPEVYVFDIWVEDISGRWQPLMKPGRFVLTLGVVRPS